MEELYSLLHSLTCGEWSAFQDYLTCFSAHNPAEMKQLRLAQLLIELKECPSDAQCSIKLYGTKNDMSFDVLKTRLKEKILDFLLTDITIDKHQELNEVDLAFIQIKKMSAQYQQLHYAKPRLALMYKLLDEIITTSIKFEFYFAVIEHLRIKRGVLSSKISKREFEKINFELDEHLIKYQLLLKAERYYQNLFLYYDNIGRPDKVKIIPFLKKAIAEIENENKEIKSPIVNYYLKNLEMDYYQLYGDYTKSRSVCLELLNVVRNNKSVYRRQRVGVVYDNLSRCDYYLGWSIANGKLSFVNDNGQLATEKEFFSHAVEAAQHAQKHFNLNSENYCIALEQEFYAVFAMKEYQQAVTIAEKMISSATRKELGGFRYAKYNYLLANALLKLDKYKEALNLLSQEMEISKDKTGWEIGLRTLKIMTLLEMHKHNEAELAVLAMREFIKYTDRKIHKKATGGETETTPVSKRDRMIFNLLMQAERKGFDFSLLNGKSEKNISILNSSAEETRWEPFTHEVIPFHEWFAGKMPARHGGKKPAKIEFALSYQKAKKQKKEKAKV